MDPRKREVNDITLRPVTDEDREFLLSVYAAGREVELSLVPWDDGMKRSFIEHQYKAQDDHYRSYYENATHDVIIADGVPVGRLYLERTGKQIAILDIGVLPEFRTQGIASAIVRRLQDEARADGRHIRIYIESFNSADKLFSELGFEMTENDGGLRRFEWRPAPAKENS